MNGKVKELPTRTPTALRQNERRALAVQLRLAGKTYEEIAARLGVGRSAAYRIISRELVRRAKEDGIQLEQLRALELGRLDEMQAALWPKVQAGIVDAILGVLRILERRARLLGLDSPARHEVAGPEGGAINVASVADEREADLSCLSDQELEELERLVEKTHQCCGKENECEHN